jgi:SulP family sulfate permease
LERTVLLEEDMTLIRVFPDRDHAIEWCENQILIGEDLLHRGAEISIAEYLDEVFSETTEVVKFMSYLERKVVDADTKLMRQGESSDGLYFIESGQLDAQLEVYEEASEEFDGSGETKAIRLRAMRAGTVVGEIGMYLGTTRTASVVASKPSVLYYLSAEALKKMERNEPELASAFHQYIARMLAERLSDNNRTIQALSD